MGYLDELKPSLRFDRWDYVRALRALLPRGTAWCIPLPSEQDIRPFSILTAERFGRVTITTGNTVITPDGIESAEAFGLLVINAQNIVDLSGIPSSESFGLPYLYHPNTLILLNSILTSENFGLPTVTPEYPFVQYCDFSVGLCPGFDNEFYANWYQTTEHGEGIAQRASDGTDRLYPVSGHNFTGDFLVEFGLWRSSPDGVNNTSVHMIVYRADTNTQLYDVMLVIPNFIGNGGIYPAPMGPVETKFRIERVAGVLWCYIWTGSQWLRCDAWPTPASIMNYAGSAYLRVNGADGVNGFSYIGVNGDIA